MIREKFFVRDVVDRCFGVGVLCGIVREMRRARRATKILFWRTQLLTQLKIHLILFSVPKFLPDDDVIVSTYPTVTRTKALRQRAVSKAKANYVYHAESQPKKERSETRRSSMRRCGQQAKKGNGTSTYEPEIASNAKN